MVLNNSLVMIIQLQSFICFVHNNMSYSQDVNYIN